MAVSVNNYKCDKAFTVTELLVVISVISVLMAILMPALSAVRKQGRSIVCLSNLRQMAIAAQVYAETNGGSYPAAQYLDTSGGRSIMYTWDFTTIIDGENTSIESGLLWQGQRVDKIQQCPAFTGNSNSLSDPYTGYNYNTSYIGHGRGCNDPAPARAEAVRKPAETAIFGDGQWSGGANKFMRAPWPNPGDATFSGRYAGTQGYRHSGKTNVAWCDGHASSQKELYTETKAPEKKRIADGTGFLSPDNSAYDLNKIDN